LRVAPILKSFLFVTVPSIILMFVALEVLFRTVVPASSTPMGCFDRASGVYKFCADQGDGLRTRGKLADRTAAWHINNDGWNSGVDYRQDKHGKRVAVIGDSYIEAVNIDIDKSYPYLLGEHLGDDYEVYSFGVAGAPLSQYLNMTRYVAEKFDPDVLVINVVHNDFDESLKAYNPTSGHFLLVDPTPEGAVEEIPAAPNPAHVENNSVKRTMRASALIRYAFNNLEIGRLMRKGELHDYVANVDVDSLVERKSEVRAAIAYLIHQIREENPERRIILVLDAVRHNIYEGRPAEPRLAWIHEMMREVSEENAIDLIDLTDPMTADFAQHAHMFNTDEDGHWDEYGHAVVCGEVLEALVGDTSGCI
jgi:lysophospholipase L1-like esterase